MTGKRYQNSKYIIYPDGRCYSEISQKFLTPQMSSTYPTYNLTLPDKKRKVKVHRMVAETFIPVDDPNKTVVNHIDGNTKNFIVDNLEWVTNSENSLHAKRIGRVTGGDQTPIYYTSNLINESWEPFKENPNYLISSCGRVMNKNSKRLLKSYCDNSGGYQVVGLRINNKSKLFRIHQLVYSTFSKDYDLEGYVINHIDGNKMNNNFSNLEKVDYRQNNYHAVYVINTNACAKSVNQLNSNQMIIASFPSIAEAQRQTKISNISRAIKTGRKAGGYYWQFINN